MNGRGQYFTCKLQYQQDGAALRFIVSPLEVLLLVPGVCVLRFPGLLGPPHVACSHCSRVAFNHVRIWRLSIRLRVLPSSRVNAYKRIRVDACKRFNYLIRFSTAALIRIRVNIA